MALSIAHAFVSAKSDSADPTVVNPSNWNAQHSVLVDQYNVLGRSSAGNGQVQQIPCSAVAMNVLAASTQLAMRAAMGQSLTADIGAQAVTAAQIANNTITAAQLAGITAQAMALSGMGFNMALNVGLTASVNAGALTINLVSAAGNTPSATDPVQIAFRDATGGVTAIGLPVLRTVNAANSIVIPSGANLGVTVNSTPFRGWLVAIDNAGTVELGVVVCTTQASGTTTFSSAINNEGALLGSVTAISGAATSPGVVYAPTGVTNKAFRIIGYFEYASGLASAGVYGIVPTSLVIFSPGMKKPGDIVQTVSFITSSTTTINGTNIQTALTASITPTAAVNCVQASADYNYATSGGTGLNGRLSRGAGPTFFGNLFSQNVSSTLNFSGHNQGFDFPGTTSSTSYYVYGTQITGAGTFNSSGNAVITLNELMA